MTALLLFLPTILCFAFSVVLYLLGGPLTYTSFAGFAASFILLIQLHEKLRKAL